MQSRLFFEVLVLQSERLVRILVNSLIFFQTTPDGVFAVPQQIAVDVGHLARDADLVTAEVTGLLAVFSVGKLAVAQVAQCVVDVFDAVVFFEAVATGRIAALPFGCFVGKDVVGGVEGEGFAVAGLAVAGFLNASDFVVDVIKDSASLVGALNEIDGFVVGVGEGMTQRVGENKLFKYTIRRQYNT